MATMTQGKKHVMDDAGPRLRVDAVFQAEMSWLKVSYMLLTDATFQPPMSAMNVGLPQNSLPMLVTVATFQPPMSP